MNVLEFGISQAERGVGAADSERQPPNPHPSQTAQDEFWLTFATCSMLSLLAAIQVADEAASRSRSPHAPQAPFCPVFRLRL